VDLLQTLPATPERAQQELDFQLALGLALIPTRGSAAPEVEQTYSRARTLCAQVGDTPQLLPALEGLRQFYFNQGALSTARELGEQLWRLAQRTAEPRHLLKAHCALGITLFYLGDYAAARTSCEQGIACSIPRCPAPVLSTGGAPEVTCLAIVAHTLWCLGYPAQARRRMQEALTLVQALAHPYSLVFAQYYATWLHYRQRDVPAVQAQAEALLTLATAQGFPRWLGGGTFWRGWARAMQGEAAAGLAEMHQGRRDAAHQVLAEVYGWFTEGFDTAELQQARALLAELAA
jgi:predicted ATPase